MQKKLFVLGFIILASTSVVCAMEDDIDNSAWAKRIALWRAQAEQERKQREAEQHRSWSSGYLTVSKSKFGEIITVGEAKWRDDHRGETE